MSARSVPVTVWTAARRSMVQRAAMAMNAAFYAIVVVVLAELWRAAALSNDGTIAGYSAAAVTWYIATSEAATVSLNSRLIVDIGADIVSGAVVVELLRPVSVVRQRVLAEVGRVLPRLYICALTGAALSLMIGGYPPKPAAAVLAIPSLVLAVCCNIVAQHAFASVSFWLRESSATWFLYQKFVFMLGGVLIPLEVLPGWLRHVALATPFPSMAYAPARLASGHFQPELLLMQIGWLLGLCAVAALVFNRGEHRLEVAGG